MIRFGIWCECKSSEITVVNNMECEKQIPGVTPRYESSANRRLELAFTRRGRLSKKKVWKKDLSTLGWSH